NPVADQTGMTTIVVTVSDGSATGNASFTVTVTGGSVVSPTSVQITSYGFDAQGVFHVYHTSDTNNYYCFTAAPMSPRSVSRWTCLLAQREPIICKMCCHSPPTA